MPTALKTSLQLTCASHLHGFNFQAVARGEIEDGDYDPKNATFNPYPMRRDTFLLYPESHIVLRFRSDNPGIWLFHCHIEWHVDAGLIATMVTVSVVDNEATKRQFN